MKFFFPKIVFFFQKKITRNAQNNRNKTPGTIRNSTKKLWEYYTEAKFSKKSWEIKQTKISEQTLI